MASRRSLANAVIEEVMEEVREAFIDVPGSARPYARRYLTYLSGAGPRPDRFPELSDSIARRIRRSCDEHALAWAADD